MELEFTSYRRATTTFIPDARSMTWSCPLGTKFKRRGLEFFFRSEATTFLSSVDNGPRHLPPAEAYTSQQGGKM